MRTEFIRCTDRRTAIRRCPWAVKIIKVDGGYAAYESWTDYKIARGNK